MNELEPLEPIEPEPSGVRVGLIVLTILSGILIVCLILLAFWPSGLDWLKAVTVRIAND